MFCKGRDKETLGFPGKEVSLRPVNWDVIPLGLLLLIVNLLRQNSKLR